MPAEQPASLGHKVRSLGTIRGHCTRKGYRGQLAINWQILQECYGLLPLPARLLQFLQLLPRAVLLGPPYGSQATQGRSRQWCAPAAIHIVQMVCLEITSQGSGQVRYQRGGSFSHGGF